MRTPGLALDFAARGGFRHAASLWKTCLGLPAPGIVSILTPFGEPHDRATEVSILRRYAVLGLLAGLVGALALLAAGCGGSDSSSSSGGDVTALPASSCAPMEYKGEGDPDICWPRTSRCRGLAPADTADGRERSGCCWTSRTGRSETTTSRAGCDDATAQAAKWDPDKCSQNANAYAQNKSVIAVIGTFNSGCAAIEIPVLNQAPDGGSAVLAREHVRLPHRAVRGQRAGEVLPERQAELRACRAERPEPGRGHGELRSRRA